MNFGEYLEQRNSTSDDSTDDDDHLKQRSDYTLPHLCNELQKQQQRHLQQREPTMSSSCSPKPIPNLRQQRPLFLAPHKPITPPPPPQMLQKLTTDISTTYKKCHSSFKYHPMLNPRRVLTKPDSPCKNHGLDNRNSQYILHVNAKLYEKYIVLELLGFGTFGQVVKCRNTTTGELVAVKVIKNEPAYLNQGTIEINILRQLNRDWDPDDKHHILRLLDHFMYKNHLCLVLELLSINLYDLLERNSLQGLTMHLVQSFTKQILEALVVLSNACVIHGDLKPENILLKTMGSPEIKVVDFGTACHGMNQTYCYIQSRHYRAPEILLGMDYSSAIDMWSLGCVTAELFLGLPLFPGRSEYNQIARIIGTLGLPPDSMIQQGNLSAQYFDYSDEQGCFVLKPMEQYSVEQDKGPGTVYFETSHLDSLIMDLPRSKKVKSDTAIDLEMSQRGLLLDFLKSVLCFDPDQRLTPQEAMMHPFISQPIQPTSPSLISYST